MRSSAQNVNDLVMMRRTAENRIKIPKTIVTVIEIHQKLTIQIGINRQILKRIKIMPQTHIKRITMMVNLPIVVIIAVMRRLPLIRTLTIPIKTPKIEVQVLIF